MALKWNGDNEETVLNKIISILSSAGIGGDFTIQAAQLSGKPHIEKAGNSKGEYIAWVNKNISSLTIIGINEDDIVAYFVKEPLTQYSVASDAVRIFMNTYLVTNEGTLIMLDSNISASGNNYTINSVSSLGSITQISYQSISIITARRFGRWWRKAQAWFTTQFSSISVDLTGIATSQDVSDAKDAVVAAMPSTTGLATEANATTNKEAIIMAVNNAQPDLSSVAKDSTVAKDATVAKQGTNPNATNTAILAAFGNIDFSTLAKQGSDQTATLTAIKELLAGGGDPDIPEGVTERLAAIMQFFNITEATEYTALTPAEAIAIARDCQYNVMGTDWPIPTWLPTGVTEAQVESAAEGLGIPYHEPTQTA